MTRTTTLPLPTRPLWTSLLVFVLLGWALLQFAQQSMPVRPAEPQDAPDALTLARLDPAHTVDLQGTQVALAATMLMRREPLEPALDTSPQPLSTAADRLSRPGWRPATDAERHAAWMRSSVWLTGRVRNGTDQPLTRWIVVEPWRIDSIALQVREDDRPDGTPGAVRQERVAGRQALRSPDWNGHVKSVFPITLAPGETLRLVLVASDATVPTLFVTAWAPQDYDRAENRARMGEGMLAAATLVLALILVTGGRRDRALVLLGAWIAVTTGFESTLRAQWLFALWPALSAWQIPLFTTFGALSYAVFMLATQRLLQLPWQDWATRALLLCGAVAVTSGLATFVVEDHLVPRRMVSLMGLASVALWPLAAWRLTLAPQDTARRRLRLALTASWLSLAFFMFLARGGATPPWQIDQWAAFRVDLVAALGVLLAYRSLQRETAQAQQAHMHQLAFHDPLTSLPNRRLAHERLAQALDQGAGVAAYYLDLNRFKQINDTHGHAKGDRLLGSVADRLREQLGARGVACRLSGDEFMAIVPGMACPTEALAHAAALHLAMGQPYDLGDGVRVRAGCSIGVALGPLHGRDAETLMRHADMALYAAKAEGPGAGAGLGIVRMFEPHMDQRLFEQERLREALHLALERGELAVHAQPQVRLDDGRVSGVEVLLRWQRPGQGLVPTAQCIALAEQSGLIVPIGAWVLRQACRLAVQWPAALTVSVNVSALQLRHGHLLDTVTQALAESGLPAHRLELELTESVLIEGEHGHDEAALAVLEQVRRLGVQIAIDDFGTGYASLSYLHRLPVDRLKIDRSFIARLADTDLAAEVPTATDRSLVGAVVQIARSLGLPTVAEGVESLDLLPRLTALGCDAVQGYAIARPMPVEAFAGWYAARSAVEVTPA